MGEKDYINKIPRKSRTILRNFCNRSKCSKSRDLVRLQFAIRIASRKSLAIWRARRCDSAAIWKGFKSQIARFELRFEAFWQRFGRYSWGLGLRDWKSLATCDLWFGALSFCSCAFSLRWFLLPKVHWLYRDPTDYTNSSGNAEGSRAKTLRPPTMDSVCLQKQGSPQPRVWYRTLQISEGEKHLK